MRAVWFRPHRFFPTAWGPYSPEMVEALNSGDFYDIEYEDGSIRVRMRE